MVLYATLPTVALEKETTESNSELHMVLFLCTSFVVVSGWCMCLPCAFHLGSVSLGKSLTEWIELLYTEGKALNRHFTEDGVVSGAKRSS